MHATSSSSSSNTQHKLRVSARELKLSGHAPERVSFHYRNAELLLRATNGDMLAAREALARCTDTRAALHSAIKAHCHLHFPLRYAIQCTRFASSIFGAATALMKNASGEVLLFRSRGTAAAHARMLTAQLSGQAAHNLRYTVVEN